MIIYYIPSTVLSIWDMDLKSYDPSSRGRAMTYLKRKKERKEEVTALFREVQMSVGDV